MLDGVIMEECLGMCFFIYLATCICFVAHVAAHLSSGTQYETISTFIYMKPKYIF